jgi:hypothetical protein
MIKSDSIKELAAALAKAQGEMKPAGMDAANPHFRSKYASLASVWEAARGPLSRNGLAVIQALGVDDRGGVVLTTTLTHSSGEWVESLYPVNPVKPDPQGLGSACTYAKRYSLSALVGIVADEDDDGNEASRPVSPQNRPQSVSMREPRSPSVERPSPAVDKPRPSAPGDFVASSGRLKGRPLKAFGEIELETFVLDVQSKLVEESKTVDQMTPAGRGILEAVLAELRDRATRAPGTVETPIEPEQPTFDSFGGAHG